MPVTLMITLLNVMSERHLNVRGPHGRFLKSPTQRSLRLPPVSQLKRFNERITTQPSHGYLGFYRDQ
uniref:Uncharacterized protein n=1 Tax=Anguilla anguilla TaxID=7936 RepID=A0A0E9RFU4_ANGAN